MQTDVTRVLDVNNNSVHKLNNKSSKGKLKWIWINASYIIEIYWWNHVAFY